MERLMATKQMIDEFLDESSPVAQRYTQATIDACIEQDASALARAGYIRIAALIRIMRWVARGHEEGPKVKRSKPNIPSATSGEVPPSAVLAIPVPPLLPRKWPIPEVWLARYLGLSDEASLRPLDDLEVTRERVRWPKKPPPTSPRATAIAMPLPEEPLRTRVVSREISRRFDREV